jgi:hypothetical protein
MRRSAAALFVPVMAFLVWTVPASAQAVVEAGMATAASSVGTAGARGVGKSVGGAFKNLDKTLNAAGSGGAAKSGSATRHSSTTKAAPAQEKAAAETPKPSYEDATQIQKGIAYEELVRRYGPPVMQFAGANDTQTMSYMSPGGVVQVELQGGKVTSVAKTGA